MFKYSLMKVILTLLDNEEREFIITKNSFTIGRAKTNDICISHEGLSRVHCQVEINPQGEIIITDLSSTNGVLIQGQRIPATVPTLYQSFLGISIGPIQGIAVGLEEAIVQQAPTRRSEIPKKMAVKEKTAKNDNLHKQTSSNFKKYLSPFLLIVVIVTVLFFVGQNLEPEKDQFELPSSPRNLNL